MNFDLITGLVVFSIVSSITPGPNNVMLMASGANYGYRRTIPHMLGITLGFSFMVVIIGVGLIEVFDLIPHSDTGLKIICVVYLFFLAYKIATTKTPASEQNHVNKPFSFLQAAAFQWVNPKAWSMALTSVAIYAPDRSFLAIGLLALVFGMTNLPCISVWTLMGEKMQQFLARPGRLRIFNWVMAMLLIASLIPVLMH